VLSVFINLSKENMTLIFYTKGKTVMSDLNDNKVIQFMNNIDAEEQRKRDMADIRNTDAYKLRALDKSKSDMCDHCVKDIMCTIYKKALPLNDDYKTACSKDIQNYFDDFISSKCNTLNGMTVYITDACKRSPFAKKMLEKVDELIKDEYLDKELNIDNIDPDELVFKSSKPLQKKLDMVKSELSTDEISDAIKTNVLNSATAEINKAKEAKARMKQLETEFSQNPNIDTPEKVESALEMAGINTGKEIYTPSLFEGIMINKVEALKESTDPIPNIYGTMSVFREGNAPTTNMDLAFIESVKEYTALSTLKALKLESFSKRDVEMMAESYAQLKV
jgi:hypothetical protein